MNATHTHNGFKVSPVYSSYRRADGGGYVVDVKCSDPRTPMTYWTAPADQVLDLEGKPYIHIGRKRAQ